MKSAVQDFSLNDRDLSKIYNKQLGTIMWPSMPQNIDVRARPYRLVVLETVTDGKPPAIRGRAIISIYLTTTLAYANSWICSDHCHVGLKKGFVVTGMNDWLITHTCICGFIKYLHCFLFNSVVLWSVVNIARHKPNSQYSLYPLFFLL